MFAQVHLKSCPSYDLDTVRTAVRDILARCEKTQPLLRSGATVLLKPNVVNPQPPDKPICTHPSVVRAVAEVVREAGCEVIVADQPCYAMTRTAEYALGVPGYVEALRDLPAEMRLLNAGGYDRVAVQQPFHLHEVVVSRLVRQVDVVISLGKCKTHLQTLYTGAVKNMFGAMAPKERLVAHAVGPGRALGRAVVDIYSACVPHLALTDAVIGMEGPGPTAGAAHHVGLLAGSLDAVAVDAVIADIIGFRPGEVSPTQYAAQRGLGCGDLARIQVTGDDPADFRTRFVRPPRLHSRMPGVLNRVGRHLVFCRPVVAGEECVGCGGCLQVCPGDAIKITKRAFIERQACLECYCCIEACPHHAIKVSRSWLSKLVSPAV
jgi:uncharacterized protein (DUF362 family)/Pyruvate/2-oxoacid:ferredoxin oxidoreductase delta subunit